MAVIPMTPAETSAMIEQVKAHGFDPTVTRCCVPSSGLPGSVKGIMGCNMADRCPFHLTRMGGFRNRSWRPRNVAVYIKPDATMPHQNVIVMSCHGYVQVMDSREADAARDQRINGASEIIKVIAQEGQPYKQIVYVKANEKDPNTAFVERTIEAVVPEYKHPTQLAGSDGQRAMIADMRTAMVQEAEPTGPPVDADWLDDDVMELGK